MRRSSRADKRARRPSGSRGLIGSALIRVSRYTEILSIFARYGFVDIVRKVDISAYRRVRGEAVRPRRHGSRPEQLRRALEELGPTFVKIGQFLSHRPDLLPPEWISELEKLRNNVSPAPPENIRAVFLEDLGRPPEELFESFTPEPAACGSIAQVYRARVPRAAFSDTKKNTAGDEIIEVAVKVQRPGIRRIIEADLALMRDIARLIERRIPALGIFRPAEALQEFDRALRSELDFTNEARNLASFRRAFAEIPEITCPEPCTPLSSPRVLVMSWLQGLPISDTAPPARPELDTRLIARRAVDAVLRQIFEHRRFHSDPHGANIIILPDNRIAFLDFGQMGRILPSQKHFFAQLIAALSRQDAPRAVRAVLRWSGSRDPDETHRFTIEMEQILDHYLTAPFSGIRIGEVTAAVVELIRRYTLSVPSNFYLLAKALASIEDIAGSLHPEFNFISALRPFARRMIRSELSPENLLEHGIGITGDTLRLLADLPGESTDILSLLKAGKFRMQIDLKDLSRIDSTIQRVITRLSAAILLAAMIVGSSMLIQSLLPPLIFGLPVIGMLGFLASGIVGVFLLVDLLRHR